MDNEMTLGQWLLTLLLTMIPCVNIVMLFVWAFGNGEYVTRKRWAQAQLIFTAIIIVLYIILMVIFGASMTAMLNSMSY